MVANPKTLPTRTFSGFYYGFMSWISIDSAWEDFRIEVSWKDIKDEEVCNKIANTTRNADRLTVIYISKIYLFNYSFFTTYETFLRFGFIFLYLANRIFLRISDWDKSFKIVTILLRFFVSNWYF